MLFESASEKMASLVGEVHDAASSMSIQDLLTKIDPPRVLTERINVIYDRAVSQGPFVLYLPTVCLRFRHNPAFSLACRIANYLKKPLVVLCVVLDDHHHDKDTLVVGTARRLAFVSEILQDVTPSWQNHGALVAIRVHAGSQTRTPHHLSLAQRAAVTVTDEPFCHPYLAYVQSIERVAPCIRVDGSTTVPPVSILQRQANGHYAGVPAKAWMWESRTKNSRKAIVHQVIEGALDAPELQVKVGEWQDLREHLPKDWFENENPPFRRPWTVQELRKIADLKAWSLTVSGIDKTVPPCPQTHGRDGESRWKNFVAHHLRDYARSRNNVRQPHHVSRMSCFLNLGTVSIFCILHDLYQAKFDTSKYEDEIIKWREISYAHCFSTPAYNQETSIPSWSLQWLSRQHDLQATPRYSLQTLDACQTDYETWNAMQRYLKDTGELHNNARMTWGKTIVHWQCIGLSAGDVLKQLCYLNDRYALDGLSPCSYGGLLWCLGWCDKPKYGQLASKSASRYKVGPDGFERAKQVLMNQDTQSPSKRARVSPEAMSRMKTIDSYFASSG